MNNDLIKQMQEYCENTNNENKRIHNLLVEFVKSVGGTIDTSNRDKKHSTIYAYAYNEFAQTYSEYEVDEVRVVDGHLDVHLLDYYSENENDLWFSVLGGMMLINATLYNLCECLTEYVSPTE